jgi:tight adherence protein B
VQPWIAALLATRPTGGDVSRTLTSLAARARERGQLESELRALTAQGRLSGTVVSLAPVAFLALMAASSRKEAQALYGTRAGTAVLGIGALLDVAGLLWIRRIAGVRA